MEIKEMAMWVKPTKTGGKYLAVKVVMSDDTILWKNCFKNEYKKDDDNTPTYKSIQEKTQKQAEPKKEMPSTDDSGLPF